MKMQIFSSFNWKMAESDWRSIKKEISINNIISDEWTWSITSLVSVQMKLTILSLASLA